MPVGFEPGAGLPKLLLFIICHQELFVPLSGNLNFNHFHRTALQSCGYHSTYSSTHLWLCIHLFPVYNVSLPLCKRPQCKATDAPHTTYTSICNTWCLLVETDGHSRKSSEHKHLCRNILQADHNLQTAMGQRAQKGKRSIFFVHIYHLATRTHQVHYSLYIYIHTHAHFAHTHMCILPAHTNQVFFSV